MIKTLQKVCIEGTYLSAMKAIYVKPIPNTVRTDAEAEAPVFWSSEANSQLIGTVSDSGGRLRAEGEEGIRG